MIGKGDFREDLLWRI